MGSYISLLLLLCVLSVSTKGLGYTPQQYAKEVSYVKHEVVTGTNSGDVKGLLALQTKFILLGWNGDPCLDPILPCQWIKCNSDPSPRVTELILGNDFLYGSLPDFSSMDALESIDFSNNLLTGVVPDFLASFPNLRSLNLAYNDFTGTLPAALLSNGKLTIDISGNPRLVAKGSPTSTPTTAPPNKVTPQTPPTSSSTTSTKGGSSLPKILGLSFAIFFVLSAIGGIFAIRQHKHKSAAAVAAMAKVNNNMSQGAAVHPDQTDQPTAHEMMPHESNNV